jgi:hypothetical protein
LKYAFVVLEVLPMPLKKSLSFMLIGTVFLSGCTSWSAVEHHPDVTIPGESRLVLKNGSVLEIKYAHTEGDTLFCKGKRTVWTGFREVTDYWDVPVAVALEDVQEIKQQGVSTGRTVLAVTGTVIILGAVAGGIALAAWSPNFMGSAGS